MRIQIALTVRINKLNIYRNVNIENIILCNLSGAAARTGEVNEKEI